MVAEKANCEPNDNDVSQEGRTSLCARSRSWQGLGGASKDAMVINSDQTVIRDETWSAPTKLSHRFAYAIWRMLNDPSSFEKKSALALRA